MKLSTFISHCLFNPQTGYYRTKNPIGKNSDFITAPEINQVFGELLAAYLLQIAANNKKKIALVEMGAGKGTLFSDILASIKKLAQKNIPQALDFTERATFHIIEINEVLRSVQQKNLQKFPIEWHENFSKFLDNLESSEEIFFISNELFDCFPIDQFVKTDIGWCERLVKNKNGKNFFALDNFNPQSHSFVETDLGHEKSAQAPISAVFEYSKEARDFMSQLCHALQQKGGMAIIIDYGYIENEFANTLQAIKNHQKCDIFESPGEADITALVDFSSLERIAENFNLSASLISQNEFLTGLGIEERRKKLVEKNPNKAAEINSAIDRLINSDQMGQLFKCLIIWK